MKVPIAKVVINNEQMQEIINKKFEEIILDIQNIRNDTIDECMKTAAKAICIGCGYLDVTKCTYTGNNCMVSKPMLDTVIESLEKLKEGGRDELPTVEKEL